MCIVIARVNFGTLRKLPACTHSRVMSAKKCSTRFIQELKVGVKCMGNRVRRASHALILACLCVASVSAIE